MITVDIEWDMAKIEKIAKAGEKALGYTVDALSTEIESYQVVPFRDGILVDSQNHGVEDGVGFISWNTPYARRLYYHPEYNFNQDKHVNARGLWCDNWVYGDGNHWLKNTYISFLKQEVGGLIE